MALLKKILIWGSGILLVCAAIFYGLFLWFASWLCAAETYKEYLSPDKTLKAVIFQRDCGATTRFTTHISIIDSDDDSRNSVGNIYRIDAYAPDIKLILSWSGNNQLNIHRALDGTELTVEHQFGWFNIIKIKYIPETK